VLNIGAIALGSALLFLVVLLAAAMRGPAWSRPEKLAGPAAVIAFAALTFVSLPGLLGWPSADMLPARFRLIAVHVQQPDKQVRDAGAVFLWAVDAGDLATSAEPRAYRLPYSEPLHETAAAAATKLSKGIAQLGEFSGTGPPAGDWLREPGAHRQATVTVKFYDVPDPLHPEG
jgi:hypothetical protein